MGKLYNLMRGYGSKDATLDETVNLLLAHNWIYPQRHLADNAELPLVVEDSWEELEQAFNDGLVDFMDYRLLLRTFDDEIRQKNPQARHIFPPY